MVEVKRVNLLDQQTEMMGRGQERKVERKGSGAASLRKMMSIESVENDATSPNSMVKNKPNPDESIQEESNTTSDNNGSLKAKLK